MADILSLSKARKAKARGEKEAIAAQNRAKFGRTKADKQRESAEHALTQMRLDEAKRED
jgi:hypothetical protein